MLDTMKTHRKKKIRRNAK